MCICPHRVLYMPHICGELNFGNCKVFGGYTQGTGRSKIEFNLSSSVVVLNITDNSAMHVLNTL